MDVEFWHQRWEKNEIAFHGEEANPLLVAHFDVLALPAGSRVFLPLCGKTLDIAWLLAHGYRVVGAELSRLAVDQLFAELGVTPEVVQIGALEHHRTEDLDIFVGNIFDLTRETLGPVAAVYDRAALVALPEDMRQRYTAHLLEIAAGAPQLLICFEYDQSALPGPPFAVPEAEVRRHYDATYEISLQASVEVEGGLKKKCPAIEHVWWLRPR